jgi:hypothetical protein
MQERGRVVCMHTRPSCLVFPRGWYGLCTLALLDACKLPCTYRSSKYLDLAGAQHVCLSITCEFPAPEWEAKYPRNESCFAYVREGLSECTA